MARLLEGKPVARAVLDSVRAELAGYVTQTGHAVAGIPYFAKVGPYYVNLRRQHRRDSQ